MDQVWRKKSSKYQKIIGFIWLIMLISPAINIFIHKFVSAQEISSYAFYITLTLTFLFISIQFYWYKKKLWSPYANFNGHSKIRPKLLIFCYIFIAYGLIWIPVAYSVPHLITSFTGKNIVLKDFVVKDFSNSTRSLGICNYRLKLRSVNSMFFRFCITREEFNRLPKTEMDATLMVKKSKFGYIVKDIVLSN